MKTFPARNKNLNKDEWVGVMWWGTTFAFRKLESVIRKKLCFLIDSKKMLFRSAQPLPLSNEMRVIISVEEFKYFLSTFLPRSQNPAKPLKNSAQSKWRKKVPLHSPTVSLRFLSKRLHNVGSHPPCAAHEILFVCRIEASSPLIRSFLVFSQATEN